MQYSKVRFFLNYNDYLHGVMMLIIYPAKFDGAADALEKKLKLNGVRVNKTSLNAPGNSHENTFRRIADSKLKAVIFVGDDGGQHFCAETIIANGRKTLEIIAVKINNEVKSGIEPVGELYHLCGRDWCVPASVVSGITRQTNKPDPFCPNQDDWELIQSIMSINPGAAALLPSLFHTGSWISEYRNAYTRKYVRNNSKKSAERLSIDLMRTILTEDIDMLKGIHSFHPFVLSFFSALDRASIECPLGQGLELSKAINLYEDDHAVESSTAPDGKTIIRDCATGLSRFLRAAQTNLVVSCGGVGQADYIDILIDQLDLICAYDIDDLNMLLPYQTWKDLSAQFEGSVFQNYKKECSKTRQGLPHFMPEDIRRLIVNVGRKEIEALYLCFNGLLEHVLKLSALLVQYAFTRQDALWAAPDPTSAACVFEGPALDIAKRAVSLSNDTIMAILVLLRLGLERLIPRPSIS